MKIGARQQGDVTILDVKGKITIGVGDVALRDSVGNALESGAKNLLINLADVSTIDRRAGQRVHHRDQSRRQAQVGEPTPEGDRHPSDYSADHGLRGLRRRSRGTRNLLGPELKRVAGAR